VVAVSLSLPHLNTRDLLTRLAGKVLG
jgi:hypothetical protein